MQRMFSIIIVCVKSTEPDISIIKTKQKDRPGTNLIILHSLKQVQFLDGNHNFLSSLQFCVKCRLRISYVEKVRNAEDYTVNGNKKITGSLDVTTDERFGENKETKAQNAQKQFSSVKHWYHA